MCMWLPRALACSIAVLPHWQNLQLNLEIESRDVQIAEIGTPGGSARHHTRSLLHHLSLQWMDENSSTK